MPCVCFWREARIFSLSRYEDLMSSWAKSELRAWSIAEAQYTWVSVVLASPISGLHGTLLVYDVADPNSCTQPAWSAQPSGVTHVDPVLSCLYYCLVASYFGFSSLSLGSSILFLPLNGGYSSNSPHLLLCGPVLICLHGGSWSPVLRRCPPVCTLPWLSSWTLMPKESLHDQF